MSGFSILILHLSPPSDAVVKVGFLNLCSRERKRTRPTQAPVSIPLDIPTPVLELREHLIRPSRWFRPIARAPGPRCVETQARPTGLLAGWLWEKVVRWAPAGGPCYKHREEVVAIPVAHTGHTQGIGRSISESERCREEMRGDEVRESCLCTAGLVGSAPRGCQRRASRAHGSVVARGQGLGPRLLALSRTRALSAPACPRGSPTFSALWGPSPGWGWGEARGARFKAEVKVRVIQI